MGDESGDRTTGVGGCHKGATVALFAYNDAGNAHRRLERDLVPSLRHHPDWSFEIVVVDNSERRLDTLADAVAALPWKSSFLWHGGRNLLYGPSMNLVARRAEHPFLIYACMSHGRMVQPGWIEDLVHPMWHDDSIAMCGYLAQSAPPSVLGFTDTGQPQLHVQGGVLAARTDVLRRLPYQEAEWSHGGSDVWQSYRLMQAGFRLHHVATIFSGWRVVAPPGPWKYVHDYAHDP